MKCAVLMEHYNHDGFGTSDKGVGDKAKDFEATTSVKEGESKGKEPAPES